MSTTYPEKQADKEDAAEIKNYTRTPNMLIFGYRTISPQEKWLYTCLKHMCGKKGTRHLSLRYISEQTGISTGALSTSKDKKGNVNLGMIRHLHDAGLIHSEIKKHDGKGNAQYHITITDIWALNQEFFATRPKSEQVEGDDVNLSEFRTDSSEFRTDTPPTRPKSEQTCPNSSTILRLDSKTTDNTKIREQDYSGVDANAQHATAFIYRHDFNGRSFYYHDLCNQQQDRGCNEGMTFTIMRQSDVPHDAQCDICYQPIHAAPSNHSTPSPSGSYSQQGTTGNPLLENGEDHVLLPDHDHDVTGLDSLHADPDARRATQAGHLPLKKNNNENHSHEEMDHGLFDGTPTGTLVAGRSGGTQSTPPGESSQSSDTDARRLPVDGGTASGDVIQGVRGKARAQAGEAATAGGRGSAHEVDASHEEVAPHRGRAQTDATPSLSVENKKAVGEESKPARTTKKAEDVLTPEQRDRANALKSVIRAQRGYDLSSKGAIIDENKCIRALVRKRTDQDMIDAFKYLTKFDFKWSKTDFKFKVGGRVLFDEIDRVLQQFAENPQLRANLDGPPAVTWRGRPPATGRQISSFDDPNYDMSVEFYPSEAEKAARRLTHAGQC